MKPKLFLDGEQKQLENTPVFLPMEEIRRIERVIDNLEMTRRELQKVMEGLKPVI